MTKVTIETLKARIEHLEFAGRLNISLSEEFALEAFKMLLDRLEDDAEIQETAAQMNCRHVWTYSMLSTTKTCDKCGKMATL